MKKIIIVSFLCLTLLTTLSLAGCGDSSPNNDFWKTSKDSATGTYTFEDTSTKFGVNNMTTRLTFKEYDQEYILQSITLVSSQDIGNQRSPMISTLDNRHFYSSISHADKVYYGSRSSTKDGNPNGIVGINTREILSSSDIVVGYSESIGQIYSNIDPTKTSYSGTVIYLNISKDVIVSFINNGNEQSYVFPLSKIKL